MSNDNNYCHPSNVFDRHEFVIFFLLIGKYLAPFFFYLFVVTPQSIVVMAYSCMLTLLESISLLVITNGFNVSGICFLQMHVSWLMLNFVIWVTCRKMSESGFFRADKIRQTGTQLRWGLLSTKTRIHFVFLSRSNLVIPVRIK